MVKSSTLLIVCISFFLVSIGYCQTNEEPDTKEKYEIKLKDGSSHIGRMLSSDKNSMRFLTSSGDTLAIDKKNIENFSVYKAKPNQLNDLKSSDVARYFYTSPAFTIGKNEFAASTQGFSYSNVKYGITDNFSLEVGSSFTAWILQVPLIVITPKYRFVDSPKFKFSAYTSYMTTLPNSFGNNSNVLLFGITSTRGNESGNVSLGVSYGVVEGQFLDLPLIQLAGAKYLSPRTALIFDSQIVSFGKFINDDIGFFYNAMPGIRLMRKEHTVDLSAAIFGVNINGEGEFLVLPYVGYSIHLSKL